MNNKNLLDDAINDILNQSNDKNNFNALLNSLQQKLL